MKFYLFIYLFCLFGGAELHPWHIEVPRLRVQVELQLPADATATDTAVWDPSPVCDLHHSSRQPQILNPLSEAKDGTRSCMVASWICFCCTMMGTPDEALF